MSCDPLPPFSDLEILLPVMLRRLPIGFRELLGGWIKCLKWCGYVLRFDHHSTYLHDSVPMLAYHLMNNIVEWDDIHALVSIFLLWINVLVFSLPVSEHKVHLFALPARFGGLGISDPDHPVESGASVLMDDIHGALEFCRSAHLDQLASIRNDAHWKHDGYF